MGEKERRREWLGKSGGRIRTCKELLGGSKEAERGLAVYPREMVGNTGKECEEAKEKPHLDLGTWATFRTFGGVLWPKATFKKWVEDKERACKGSSGKWGCGTRAGWEGVGRGEDSSEGEMWSVLGSSFQLSSFLCLLGSPISWSLSTLFFPFGFSNNRFQTLA